jgi:hypothetical protein
MEEFTKGKSPFYPGQPVPVELFVGRAAQIDKIINRGVRQVAEGKPVCIYVQGEYGIGKSSIAGFTQSLAEKDYGLHGIYATLGGAKDIVDVAKVVLEATLRSGAFDPKKSEHIRNWLAKYIGKQKLFGFTVNAEALKNDAPNISSPFGMLGFLTETKKRLEDLGVKGIFLILDEINGITVDPQFSHFIKGLVDTNALSKEPFPLLLMLCGVEERRREMIQKHQPIERYFDIINIETMSDEEMEEFFKRAFESVQITVEHDALPVLTLLSAGFPKIMHLIGDAAYWIDKDGIIDVNDALDAVLDAADDVGKKYVDHQVYKALRSEDYHSILDKIAKMGSPSSLMFRKSEMADGLSDTEKRKLNNFLQRMKKLKVLRSGDVPGEYIFNHRMVRLYIWLHASKKIVKRKELNKNI